VLFDTPFADPVALIAGMIAAALVGLAKGGLGSVGVMAVPVLSLVMSPVQAAGIMLPILIVSDGFSLYTWWRQWHLRTLRNMLPGAVAGVGIGWATAALVSDDVVRLIVGVVAVGFVLRWATQGRAARAVVRPQRPVAGQFWGGLAGYTSFVAHAGGPPFSVYAMPLNLDPKVLTSTSVVFFATVNALKLIPYFALGQFGSENLLSSAIVAPVAIAFTFVGAFIIRRMRAEVFYPIAYTLTFLLGVRLIWDGWSAL
jgi:uncharacterized membrane protein YfcA